VSAIKNIVPALLALVAGVWLIGFGFPQFVGGARLFFEEDTLSRLAGTPFAQPATPALLAEAIAVWSRAAPELNDTTTWTQYGDILVSSANANNTDIPMRDKRLAEAAIAYRTALELSPSNGRAWTMLAAVRIRLGATPEEASADLRMSLRTAPRDGPLVLPRLDTAFFIWRVMPADLRAAMLEQVRIATLNNAWAFVRLVHQHYILEPVRDLLAYDRNLQWTFDRAYMSAYP
jgi:tetratricopeptide (TPR) repeat protein